MTQFHPQHAFLQSLTTKKSPFFSKANLITTNPPIRDPVAKVSRLFKAIQGYSSLFKLPPGGWHLERQPKNEKD
jgi:hypothetical protein